MVFSGALKFLVLKILSEKNLTGTRIIKSVEEKTGWKVSCGSIYPLLSELVESNLIKLNKEKKNKEYKITDKGKNFLKDTDKKKKEIIRNISEGLSLLNMLESDKSKINKIKQRLTLNYLEDFLIYDNLFEFKEQLLKVNLKKHSKEINKILNEAKIKMEKLK